MSAWTVRLIGGPWGGRELAVPDLRDLLVAKAETGHDFLGAEVRIVTGRYVRVGPADPNAGTAVMAWTGWDTE